MNKSQAALTIAKLLGTAIALTVVLIGTMTIEALQGAVKFGTWAIGELNKPQPSVAVLAPETVISKLRTADPENQSIQKTISSMTIESIIPMPAIAQERLSSTFKLPINPYREIIKQLPITVLSLKYLKDWAKSIGIKGYSKMPKAKLVAALRPA